MTLRNGIRLKRQMLFLFPCPPIFHRIKPLNPLCLPSREIRSSDLLPLLEKKEGSRFLREVFFPRRQAFTAIAFQAAKDRGEIPQDADIKFLMDLLYGYSLIRMITRQIDDDEIPDRIGATIAKLAHSGISNPVRTQHSNKTSVKTKTSLFTPS